MHIAPDIRFIATGPQTLSAASVSLPIRLTVDRPTGEAALAAARRIVDSLRAALASFATEGGRLELTEPAQRSEFSLIRRTRDEVKLALTLVLVLTPTEGNDFWERARVVVRATDFAQEFAHQSNGKGVKVDVGRAIAVKADDAAGVFEAIPFDAERSAEGGS